MITPSVENHHDYSGFHLKLERGIKQKKDFVLHPHEWVRLRLVNMGPHFPGDKITYRIGVGGARHLYGPANHEDIYLVFGNSQATVSCTVFRGDEVTQFKSVVPFVAAFDTISHLIEY